jgi:hypothetical protein
MRKQETMESQSGSTTETQTYELILRVSCFVKAKNKEELQGFINDLATTAGSMSDCKNVTDVKFRAVEEAYDEKSDISIF